MKTHHFFPHWVIALAAPSLLTAEEISVKPQIESVGLFKNGIAIITASFPAKEAGIYLWADVPRVVHGTFWVESNAKVTVQTTTRLLESANEFETSTGYLQRDLEGKEVSITLKPHGDGPATTTGGRVWTLPETPKADKTWDRSYQSTDPFSYSYGMRGENPGAVPQPNSTGGFLVLDRGDKRQYIDTSSIASLEVAGPFTPKTKKEERPVLLFHVNEADAATGMIRVSYLSKGMTWVPSYQLDLTDPAKLTLRQNALVRNELMDVKDTELSLVSGFPNIRFSHVDSPMWPGQSLSAFFAQSSQQGSAAANMMSQQMIYSNSARFSEAPTVPDVVEAGNASGDIHFESIGKQTLAAGDSLARDVASGTAEYKRVIEWKMADLRDNWGRYQQPDRSVPNADEEPWDAIQFSNPLKFPMTTASAIFIESGKFRGQSMANWVNPGQSTCMRVTKALSVSAKNSEVEVENSREEVNYMGRAYRKSKVKGTAEIRNYRTTEITFVARLEYSGEFISAEADPVKTLLTQGVGSVNARRELEWTLQLAPGETKTLNYEYSVIVLN